MDNLDLAEKLEYIKRYSPTTYRHLIGIIDAAMKWIKTQGHAVK